MLPLFLRRRLMTITTNATKQIQNIKPLIAVNVQKKSPNDSNIYFSRGGRLHAQKNAQTKITNNQLNAPLIANTINMMFQMSLKLI
jgi:hypothetical protein